MCSDNPSAFELQSPSGKALLPLAGTTVLGLMIARVKVAKKVDQIIVATTSNTVDDPLCEEAVNMAHQFFAVQKTTFWIASTVLLQSMEQCNCKVNGGLPFDGWSAD